MASDVGEGEEGVGEGASEGDDVLAVSAAPLLDWLGELTTLRELRPDCLGVTGSILALGAGVGGAELFCSLDFLSMP